MTLPPMKKSKQKEGGNLQHTNNQVEIAPFSTNQGKRIEGINHQASTDQEEADKGPNQDRKIPPPISQENRL